MQTVFPSPQDLNVCISILLHLPSRLIFYLKVVHFVLEPKVDYDNINKIELPPEFCFPPGASASEGGQTNPPKKYGASLNFAPVPVYSVVLVLAFVVLTIAFFLLHQGKLADPDI